MTKPFHIVLALVIGIPCASWSEEKDDALSSAPGAKKGEAAEEESPIKPSKEWTVYSNPRFGFDLPVPPNLQASPPPENGGGQEFRDKAGNFTLAAYAHFVVEEEESGLDAQWEEAIAVEGREIKYKKKTDTWFVVSGTTEEGEEFYEKVFSDGQYFAAFSIAYPAERAAEFKAWVEKIEKEFKPNLGKGMDKLPSKQKKEAGAKADEGESQ